MGGVSPETCWASYKYGIINFDTLLHVTEFFYMNYNMMHGMIHEPQVHSFGTLLLELVTHIVSCYVYWLLRGALKISFQRTYIFVIDINDDWFARTADSHVMWHYCRYSCVWYCCMWLYLHGTHTDTRARKRTTAFCLIYSCAQPSTVSRLPLSKVTNIVLFWGVMPCSFVHMCSPVVTILWPWNPGLTACTRLTLDVVPGLWLKISSLHGDFQ
jgi:hypothetical protein